MIKVVVTKSELKGLQCPDVYMQNKLIKAGIPITGLFSFSQHTAQGTLTKVSISDDLIEYTWSEDGTD